VKREEQTTGQSSSGILLQEETFSQRGTPYGSRKLETALDAYRFIHCLPLHRRDQPPCPSGWSGALRVALAPWVRLAVHLAVGVVIADAAIEQEVADGVSTDFPRFRTAGGI
jgi:hypothetical protein